VIWARLEIKPTNYYYNPRVYPTAQTPNILNILNTCDLARDEASQSTPRDNLNVDLYPRGVYPSSLITRDQQVQTLLSPMLNLWPPKRKHMFFYNQYISFTFYIIFYLVYLVTLLLMVYILIFLSEFYFSFSHWIIF